MKKFVVLVCFIAVSTFLITTAETGPPVTDGSPTNSTNSPPPTPTPTFFPVDIEDNEVDQKCSCTYDYENSFVKARVGNRMLERGDIIKQGETVSFECRYVNMVLEWKNGLRFFGRAEMTCSTCEKWQGRHLPTCKSSMKIKAVLGQDEDLAVLPSGIIQVQKGENRTFFCSNVWKQPQWKFLEKEGVSETKIENIGQGETIYVSYLNIMNAQNEHSGIYECFTRSDTGEQIVPTSLHLQVIASSCGDPGYVNNARRIGKLFTFPNKVEYECEEGYKLRGLHSRYCQAGGEWSGRLPTCEQIYCSIPKDPINGRVTYSSLKYGTELKYECKVGFLLKEDEPRFCSENGIWSDKEPECIEATCEEPQPPKHGTVTLHGDLKVGSLATYSCDPGRRLVGATTTKCLNSGTWTFDAPECLSSCKVPFIESGEMGRYEIQSSIVRSYEEFKEVLAGENVDSGETLTLRCKRGFLPVENSKFLSNNRLEVTCEDGMWSKDMQCKQSSCKVPFIESGEMGRYKIQSSIFRNYEEFKEVLAGENVDSGETLTLRCKGDSLPVENSEFLSNNRFVVTCEDGTWSKDMQCKQTQCSGPPPPSKNAMPVIKNRAHGYIIFYICTNTNHEKIKGNVTCDFGSWIGIPPRCLSQPCYTKDLNYPGLIKPAEEIFDSSESFQVNCEIGYKKARRLQNITCASGRWDISQRPCKHDPKCSIYNLAMPIPEGVEPDTLNETQEYVTVGSEVRLKCSENKVMTGDSKAQCGEQGQWILGKFECVMGCLLNLDPSSNLIVQPIQDSYRVGDFVYPSCPPGEEMSSKVERLMCLPGHWSENLPECKESKKKGQR